MNFGIARTITGFARTGFAAVAAVAAFAARADFAVAAVADASVVGGARGKGSSSGLLPIQTALGLPGLVVASMKGLGGFPAPAAICSMDRPEATERSSFSSASAPPAFELVSRCLISSQLVRLPPNLSPRMRTRTQLP